MDWLTERKIKDAAQIVDVVGHFCTLRKAGPEYTCACPIHLGQQMNHFKVNPKKNLFYCFVCGAGGDPIEFLMRYSGTRYDYPTALRWLANYYHIPVDDNSPAPSQLTKKELPPTPIQEELPTLTLPFSMVNQRSETSADTLCKWLRALPWDGRQRERVDAVLKAYFVGHSKNGMTIFWQVDENGYVRTGKMMRYQADGHRDKTASYAQDWVHSTFLRAGLLDVYDPEEKQVKPCLFGLHLLNNKSVDTKTVNIVESEKTALICAIAYGSSNGLWMATGGMQFFSRERLQPLIDRGMQIVIYPDHDGVERWQAVAKKMGVAVTYNNQFVDAYWRKEDGPKADAADIIVRLLLEAEQKKTKSHLSELIGINPALNYLIEKFDLTEAS